MNSKFPPGLLNPGQLASGESRDLCARVLGVACPTGREFVYNLFFSGYGIWMLFPLSVLLLLLYRLVGPPEVCVMCPRAGPSATHYCCVRCCRCGLPRRLLCDVRQQPSPVFLDVLCSSLRVCSPMVAHPCVATARG